MKKIFTLFLASMLVLSISAIARAPQVILNSRTNYEISIDGRIYSQAVGATTISDLNPGVHTVNVYTVSRVILGIGKRTKLVSTQQFTLRNNDVSIDVSPTGQASISNYGIPGKNDPRNNGSYNNDKGNGNKYGHYKNKKDKKRKNHDQCDNRNKKNDNNRRDNDD